MYFASGAKTGLEVEAKKKLGDKSFEASVQIRRKEQQTLSGYCTRTARTARMIWENMLLLYLLR